MQDNLIMFGSVTLAMKSRSLLMKHKIKSRPVRTPLHLTNKSCGYSLLVARDFDRALTIIKSNGIAVKGTAAVSGL